MAKANRSEDAIKLLEKGIAVPGLGNQHILYQCAIQVAASAGDFAKAEAIATKGLAGTPKGNFSRYKVAETALRVFAGYNNSEVLRRFQALAGPEQIDEQQRLLVDYYLTRITGN